MNEEELNDEVIKIFIESWLVKYESFTLAHSFIEKSFNGYKVVFRLRDRHLELFAVKDHKVLERVQIVNVNSSKCIAFAMEAYLVFYKTICEIKKNH